MDIIAGKYEVLEELGRGGMGRVYKVLHRGLQKVYAMKVLLGDLVDNDSVLARFHKEAQIMARLQHPNIVQVFDVDRDADYHYFVMEYIDGLTLSKALRLRAPLPIEEFIDICTQIGRALAYAHTQRPPVIHRDIKPANVMIENGSGRVVVTDFGIAKLLDTELTHQTQTGYLVGTPLYASPEQLKGDREIDGRSDIFSFGLMMYEMLAGRPFFENKTPHEVIGLKLFDPHDLVPEFDTGVPEDLRRIVARAIAKDREQRYPAMSALLDDLQRLGDTEGTIAAPLESPKQSRRWPWLIGFGVSALGVVTLVVWLRYPDEPEPIPVPDVNRPPAIAEVAPADDRLDVPDGDITLSVSATDPDDGDELSYAWLLDDKPLAETGEQITLNDLESGSHQVTVIARDRSGAEARHQWILTVPEPPPPANQPPRILAWSPRASEITLREGEALDFSIEAIDPEGDPDLRYRWLLDNSLVATGPSWRYQPDFDAGGDHTLRAEVIDDQGATATRQWSLTVADVNRAPELTRATPAQQALISETGDAEFQIEVTDPDRDDRLSYTWKLDDQSLGAADNRLRLTDLANGTYSVSVNAEDPKGASASHTWQLTVNKPQQPAIPSLRVDPASSTVSMQACTEKSFQVTNADEYGKFRWLVDGQKEAEQGQRFVFSPTDTGSHTVKVEAVAGGSSATHAWQIQVTPAAIGEADVNQWLANYQQATEQGDAEALNALGELYSEQEIEELKQRQKYRMLIQDVRAVARDGKVDLKFEQVDQWYNPNRYTMVIDYTSQNLALTRSGCEKIVARRN